MTLQEQIIRYRAKNNLSQKEFGALIGLTKQTISGIENGKSASKLTEEKIRLLVGGSNDNINQQT